MGRSHCPRTLGLAANGQAAGFLPERGFEPAGDGVFHLDLTNDGPAHPAGVALREAANA